MTTFRPFRHWTRRTRWPIWSAVLLGDTLSDPYPDDTREQIEEAVARGIEEYERRVDWLTQLGAEKDPDHPERGWRIPIEPIS